MRLFLLILRLVGALVVVLIQILTPVLLVVFGVLAGWMALSISAILNGPGPFTNRLASDWTRRLIELGAPPDRIDPIFSLCRFTARSVVVLGWLVSVVFTVEILRVVFGILI